MPDEASESRLLRKDVDESLVMARRALSDYQQAAAAGNVGHETQKLLLNSAIDLFNALKHWRNDPQIGDVWEDNQLDEFQRLLREEQRTSSGAHPRLSSPQQQGTQLKAGQLSPTQLADVIDGLTEVAKELGFLPETTDRTPLEKGTREDIRWLLNTREQNKALEELEPPQNDEEALPDGGVSVATPTPETRTTGMNGTESAVNRYPFRGPFFQLISERKQQGKDAKIAVASANAETGVGKSTCAYYLAHVLDTSSAGYYIDEKATLGVDEFLDAYNQLPKGSSLILDEAEQLTGRRAMSKQNVKAGERWQMCRVQEICSLLTLPKFSVLDSLMRDLVDFRIEIERRGLATIYKKSHRPFGDTWWQAIQQFEFPSMDNTVGMDRLHALKDEFISEGEGGNGMVSESTAKKEAEKAAKNARREDRDEMIFRLKNDGLTQSEIVERLEDVYGEDSSLAVSRRRVGQILEGGPE